MSSTTCGATNSYILPAKRALPALALPDAAEQAPRRVDSPGIARTMLAARHEEIFTSCPDDELRSPIFRDRISHLSNRRLGVAAADAALITAKHAAPKRPEIAAALYLSGGTKTVTARRIGLSLGCATYRDQSHL